MTRIFLGGGNGFVEIPETVSPVVPNPTWAQADWYVDPVHGDDDADGLTTGTAVRTIMGGIVAKWGTTSPVLQQTTTIHLMATQTLGQEFVVLQPTRVKGTAFIIDGTPGLRPIATFNLGVITPKSRVGAGSPLKSTGFTAPGLDVGQLVVNDITGTHSFIQALAGGTATLAQPLEYQTPQYTPQPTEDDTWTAGQQVTVYEVPLLNLEVLAPAGGDSTDYTTNGMTWVNAIHIPDNGGTPGNSFFAVQLTNQIVNFQDCVFDPFMTSQGGVFTHHSGHFSNCAFNSGGEVSNVSVNGGYSNQYPLTLDEWAVADLDHIASAGFNPGGAFCFVGYLYVPGTAPTIFCYPGTNLIIDDDLNGTPGACLYGGAALTVGANAAVLQRSGGTWANRLQLTGTLSLMDSAGPVTTGSSYAAGAFTDGVAINTTNLDAHGGLQNPVTGARFAIAIGP